jgi:hypothetical protein
MVLIGNQQLSSRPLKQAGLSLFLIFIQLSRDYQHHKLCKFDFKSLK